MNHLFKTGLLLAATAAMLFACNTSAPKPDAAALAQAEAQIAATLDSFNVAAADADFDRYFDFYTEDGIFTGTDATERWDKARFMVWAKPFFDKGAAWNFTSVERHIYLDPNGEIAWFDELLNTQMKICRGSGVMVKRGDDWKVQQYILSMTVPNSQLDAVLPLKAAEEDSLMEILTKK